MSGNYRLRLRLSRIDETKIWIPKLFPLSSIFEGVPIVMVYCSYKSWITPRLGKKLYFSQFFWLEFHISKKYSDSDYWNLVYRFRIEIGFELIQILSDSDLIRSIDKPSWKCSKECVQVGSWTEIKLYSKYLFSDREYVFTYTILFNFYSWACFCWMD